MKIRKMECPVCHMKLIPKVYEGIIKCNHCGMVFNIDEKNEIEKIKDLLKEKGKYYGSYDYKKKLDIERENLDEKNKDIIKQMVRILIIYFLFQMVLFLIIKLFDILK